MREPTLVQNSITPTVVAVAWTFLLGQGALEASIQDQARWVEAEERRAHRRQCLLDGDFVKNEPFMDPLGRVRTLARTSAFPLREPYRDRRGFVPKAYEFTRQEATAIVQRMRSDTPPSNGERPWLAFGHSGRQALALLTLLAEGERPDVGISGRHGTAVPHLSRSLFRLSAQGVTDLDLSLVVLANAEHCSMRDSPRVFRSGARRLAAELQKRQRSDGAWSDESGTVPCLLTTTLALEALLAAEWAGAFSHTQAIRRALQAVLRMPLGETGPWPPHQADGEGKALICVKFWAQLLFGIDPSSADMATQAKALLNMLESIEPDDPWTAFFAQQTLLQLFMLLDDDRAYEASERITRRLHDQRSADGGSLAFDAITLFAERAPWRYRSFRFWRR